ncbi:SA1788 family PVL leukocidin-associated protein [Staphylococcus saprophyticus]|uniref:SA1788 family PVL leukocidin-associated protein n=1 Tax=Staphylococcus saprophyticus TaxID=29385 RepID=UPI0022EB6715|nr:SA1788 family PVL leukocidin-associated protein [Staphylococcus saprophyticus]
MKQITIDGYQLYVHPEHEAKAEALGLSAKYIRTRLKNGWTVHEAYSAPKGIRLEDYREAQNIEYMESKARKTRQRLREEKHRKLKPHLYDGTPQKHSRDVWCQYLMNTSIFPKAVH